MVHFNTARFKRDLDRVLDELRPMALPSEVQESMRRLRTLMGPEDAYTYYEPEVSDGDQGQAEAGAAGGPEAGELGAG
jgi:hypothetical protein